MQPDLFINVFLIYYSIPIKAPDAEKYIPPTTAVGIASPSARALNTATPSSFI